MSAHTYTSQAQVRAAFWLAYCAGPKPARWRGKSQNQLPADVRMAFVDFVDNLERDGAISARLAGRVTP